MPEDVPPNEPVSSSDFRSVHIERYKFQYVKMHNIHACIKKQVNGSTEDEVSVESLLDEMILLKGQVKNLQTENDSLKEKLNVNKYII